MDAGADLNIKPNIFSDTALDFAAKHGYFEIVEMLQAAGISNNVFYSWKTYNERSSLTIYHNCIIFAHFLEEPVSVP